MAPPEVTEGRVGLVPTPPETSLPNQMGLMVNGRIPLHFPQIDLK